ncbi:hypothetical protein XBFM1_750077 [Xenorhabdus bovienii str. feltiae Moldova]|uniref:Uncharacterized protein n=1 Tax=Xenorhabdus bovienii str. feltiae Moldova TaxID=1398200 RepID=A0A077P0F2_XENBV|nr:hypothetical protein XBFM1_750077 [Xenorhabdus bovienii str. feltiae Moldova]
MLWLLLRIMCTYFIQSGEWSVPLNDWLGNGLTLFTYRRFLAAVNPM